ncbi:MAG: O-antigen ligase family protein [Planctomycetota bacterium]
MSVSTRVSTLWLAGLLGWAGSLAVYGGVSPAAVATLAAWMACLNVAAMFLLPGPLLLSRPAVAFLAGVALLLVLQLAPGLGFLFPWTSALRASHGAAGAGPGTADAFLTVRQAAQVAAYALAALLTLRLTQAGLRRSLALNSILVVLALQATYAVAQTGFRFETLPFFGKRFDLESASGTLVNRNNFAGLMAMGVALAAGAAWGRWTSRRRDAGKIALLESGLSWALAAALFAAAIVLSRSRGGALAAVAGVVALAFVWQRRTRGAAVAGGAALALAAGVTIWAANAEPLIERFESMEGSDLTQDTRVVCWKATLSAAARQPVLGFGLGSYPRAFRPFQPPSLPGQFRHAHSEYVNALFEGGAAWALLLVAGLAFWGVRAVRGLPTLDGAERAAASAAVAAVLAAAVHALVDFDLRITGVGLLFAVLLGLAPAFSSASCPFPRAAWAAAALVTLALAATLAFAGLDPEDKARAASKLDPAAAELALHKILRLSPCDADAAWYLARAAERRDDFDLAAKRFETAASLWPANPETQIEAGIWLWIEGKRGPAGVCLRRAFEGEPGTVEEALERLGIDGPVVEWEALMPTPAAGGRLAVFLARRGRWEEAAAVFWRLVPASRENAPGYDALAEAFGEAGQWGLEATVREARLAVTSDAAAHAAAARAWGKLEAWDAALVNARIAARLDPANMEGPCLVADFLEAQGDRLAAAQAVTDALASHPGDPLLLTRRANLYLNEKLWQPAIDDARAALASQPGRRGAVIILARALIGAGRRAEAVEVLRGYLASVPGDAEAARLRDEAAGP